MWIITLMPTWRDEIFKTLESRSSNGKHLGNPLQMLRNKIYIDVLFIGHSSSIHKFGKTDSARNITELFNPKALVVQSYIRYMGGDTNYPHYMSFSHWNSNNLVYNIPPLGPRSRVFSRGTPASRIFVSYAGVYICREVCFKRWPRHHYVFWLLIVQFPCMCDVWARAPLSWAARNEFIIPSCRCDHHIDTICKGTSKLCDLWMLASTMTVGHYDVAIE